MATSKKTTKKVTPRAATKAAAVKKTPAKKTTSKATSAKKSSAKNVQMRSFHISPEERAFMDVQVTRQTLYWIILVAFIIFVQLWILQLHIEVTTLLDAQQQQLSSME